MRNRDVTIKICNRSGKNIVEKSESLMRFCEKNKMCIRDSYTGQFLKKMLK